MINSSIARHSTYMYARRMSSSKKHKYELLKYVSKPAIQQHYFLITREREIIQYTYTLIRNCFSHI